MATIKDVAKRANVSTTTVSHVINKTRFVAEETRNAVGRRSKSTIPQCRCSQPEG
jgi:LacI family purine nucleotide synthesis repressor